MMRCSPSFLRIVSDLCTFLLAVPGHDAAVKIKRHIVKPKLLKKPSLYLRKHFRVPFQTELAEKPAIRTLRRNFFPIEYLFECRIKPQPAAMRKPACADPYACPEALNDIDRIIPAVRLRLRQITGAQHVLDPAAVYQVLHQLHSAPRCDIAIAVLNCQIFRLHHASPYGWCCSNPFLPIK